MWCYKCLAKLWFEPAEDFSHYQARSRAYQKHTRAFMRTLAKPGQVWRTLVKTRTTSCSLEPPWPWPEFRRRCATFTRVPVWRRLPYVNGLQKLPNIRWWMMAAHFWGKKWLEVNFPSQGKVVIFPNPFFSNSSSSREKSPTFPLEGKSCPPTMFRVISWKMTIPSDTKLVLTQNCSEIIDFGKLANLTRNSLKCLYFLDMSRAQHRSKITKNSSQGITFVIISCQRVGNKIVPVHEFFSGAIDWGLQFWLRQEFISLAFPALFPETYITRIRLWFR